MHSRLNRTNIREAANLRPLLLRAHRAAGRNPLGFSLHPFPAAPLQELILPPTQTWRVIL